MDHRRDDGVGRWVKRASLGVLAVLVLAFFVQNTEVTQVALLFWTVEMSRAVLLALVLLVGIGAGWLLAGLRSGRRH